MKSVPQGEYWIIKRSEQKEFLKSFIDGKTVDKPFCVKFEDKVEPRTKRQNRFLFGWVYPVIVDRLENAGIQIPLEGGGTYPYDKEIIHEISRRKFLIVETKRALRGDGSTAEIPIIKSTASLKKSEFHKYLEDVKKFVYEFWGFMVPDPVEGYWADFYEQLK